SALSARTRNRSSLLDLFSSRELLDEDGAVRPSCVEVSPSGPRHDAPPDRVLHPLNRVEGRAKARERPGERTRLDVVPSMGGERDLARTARALGGCRGTEEDVGVL